jgi:hypothetical protein
MNYANKVRQATSELPKAIQMSDIEMAMQIDDGIESLQTRYKEGDIVATPDGDGVVSGVWEASWEDDGETIEASEDSPAYTVALVDGGFGHFKASDLSETDLETDVEEPISDLEALIDVQTATGNYEALDWTNPPSWRESETPARVIALKAWADMNGQFDCGGACCMGDLKDAELCASLKDYVLGTEQWRGWGPDTGNESLAGQSGTEALDWEPELHPRDEEGKFTERGGIIDAGQKISSLVIDRATDTDAHRSEISDTVDTEFPIVKLNSDTIEGDGITFEDGATLGPNRAAWEVTFTPEESADEKLTELTEKGYLVREKPGGDDIFSEYVVGVTDETQNPTGRDFESVSEIVESGLSESERITEFSNFIESETGIETDITGLESESARVLAEELTEANATGELEGVDTVEAGDISGDTGDRFAEYTESSETLSFNRNLFTERQANNYGESGYLADGSLKHIVSHEIGHARHFDGLSDSRQSELQFGDIEVPESVSDTISEYAGTDAMEFVAEVYALKRSGESVSNDVQELYEEFDGPTVS